MKKKIIFLQLQDRERKTKMILAEVEKMEAGIIPPRLLALKRAKLESAG